ncbi:cytochrome p450 [Diplodia corticola]|uniref:Cytochrome p450 n=1 Tax=Diplodia corticola TaxID=236234 RepID=A0A1J9RN27_9PEZI|nr:cytochrome p450 [Diplodia corticola]OJD29903.1 cytochrome p450 [Diplodia corticola]
MDSPAGPVPESPPRILKIGSVPSLFGIFVSLLVVKFVVTAVYNVYFHPLSKYPGPKLALTSNLVWWMISYTGKIEQWTRKQHETYGEIVRLGPDRLSYINPQAWKDIYGHRSAGKKENGKDLRRFYTKDINDKYHVLNTPDVVEHGNLRRIFSNAFSEKALKLQEPLIKRYVDKLIWNMYRMTKEDPDVSLGMVKLYNLTTFDIISDLTFGEPLGLLEQSEYTPWVQAIFANVKAQHMQRIQLEFPMLGKIMSWFIPQSLIDQQKAHFQHSAERVDRRLEKGVDGDKPDIWGLVLAKGKDNQLGLGEMHANSSIFMIAGSETTATLLSGLTFYLLKNPDKLRKVVDEVRAVASEDELTLELLPRMPYLNACFEEGLRVYPPVPIGPPREVPQGGNVICGDWVPEKTRVSVHQWSAYRSALNFKDPDSFIPERWLPGNVEYESDQREVLQPFSFGPRNCLGKNLAYHEMRIILSKVLWHFDLELCEQSQDWANHKSFTLWEKPELWCKAKPIRA